MPDDVEHQEAAAPPRSDGAPPQSDAMAMVWPGLPEFWLGQARTAPLAHAVGHTLRTCRILLEANQRAAVIACDMARRQQESAFAAAQATLSVLPGTAERTGGVWSRTMAAYADACGHGLDTMRTLAEAALAAPPPAATVAANRPETTGQR